MKIFKLLNFSKNTNSKIKNKPLLVTGTHRSGTTWIGRVLEKSDIFEYLQEPMNIENKKGIRLYDYWFQYIKEGESNLYNPLIKLKKKAEKRNKVALFKDPIAFFSIDTFINKVNADVLIAVRNPFSFASSLKRLDWQFDFNHFLNQEELMDLYLQEFKDEIVEYSKSKKDIVLQASLLWNIFYTSALNFKSKYPQIELVKHEDLSLNPYENFSKLCKNLSIPYTNTMNEYLKETTDINNSTEVKNNVVHQLERNSKDNIFIYKQRLSEKEIEDIYDQTKVIFNQFYDKKFFFEND